MRKLGFILLISLLMFGLSSSMFAGVTDVARTEGLNIPDPMGGMIPGRDPVGEDNIFYDDGDPGLYYVFGGIFTAVRFTPNSDFRLQAIKFVVNNQNNVNTATTVRVHSSVNQNVGQELYKADYEGPFENNQWMTHEIPEASWDAVTFAAGEDFFLVVGPAPGPVQQNAQGWWLCCDAGSVTNRNWLATKDANNNPTQWQQLANDCMIRANGTYLNEFFDVGVLSAWNKSGEWLVTPGSSQSFAATLSNFGADVMDDEYEVTWKVTDPEGEVIFDYSMAGLRMNMGDTLQAFECDKAWEVPLDAVEGNYVLTVGVELLIEEDTNPDNDAFPLEQLVFNPPEADPQVWMEFLAPDYAFDQSNMIGDTASGWGSVIPHPGDEFAYRITTARMAVNIDSGAAKPGMLVGILNYEAMQFRWIQEKRWDFNFVADTSMWVELEINPDSGIFRKGEGIIIMYWHHPLSHILMDNRAPIAAAANPDKMAMTSVYGRNARQGFSFSGSGDYAVGGKFVVDDSPPPGKHLKFKPATLDFNQFADDSGNIPRDMDWIIEAYAHSYGDAAVQISNLFLNATVRPYITWDPVIDANNKKSIQPGDSLLIIAKLHIPADAPEIDYSGNCIVTNDGDDNKNMPWLVKVRSKFEVSVEDNYGLVPNVTSLGQNYPNPFNPTTVVPLSLEKSSPVELTLIDLSGRTVQTIFNGELSAGIHAFEVNAGNLPAGIYFYRMVAGDFKATAKMVLMK